MRSYGTKQQFIWSNMVLKKWKEIRKKSIFLWVGEERARGFSPLVLWRGTEGVCKTVLGKTTESGRRIVVRLGGMEAEVFRLPQGLGIIYENSFQKKV